jgi:ankyrin repeat protein
MRNDLYLNIRDHKKRTLLHYAAFGGSIDITELLLQKGMNINDVDDLGKTPFDIAYEGNFYEGNIR